MQRLQMNPRWEWGLISLTNSYLAFSLFNFSKTTLLQLSVYTYNCPKLIRPHANSIGGSSKLAACWQCWMRW